jgi:Zn-finger nucleic acid-binding protein
MSSKRNRTVRATAPAPPAPRYPCPVCLGVQMHKLRPQPAVDLELDHCDRCGGIWFDRGEVDRLRRANPQALATKVKMSEQAWSMQCHSCHASMSRNDERCPACGWKNVLLCPVCQRTLAPVFRDGLRIDICRQCRGAWFDNVELAEIWNRSVSALARRRGEGAPPERFVEQYFLLDALFWYPLAIPGGLSSPLPGGIPETAGGLIDAGAGSADIGDVAGQIVDGTGEAAGGLFDWVADFLAGFDF